MPCDEPLRVDVVMGGPGREADVSRMSGRGIVEALRARGHDVVAIDCPGRLDLARLRGDSVVFDIIHGTYGEDGELQAALERAGRAFVGSDAAASRLCMDKQATKERLAQAGLPVPWGLSLDAGGVLPPVRPPAGGGVIVKPRADGSSVGLRLLDDPAQLPAALRALVAELGPVPVLVEERLAGPEYTVAVLDEDEGPRALPPIRIIPPSGSYDYHSKYVSDETRYEILREGALADELRSLGLDAHRACACRDLSRTDVMAAADGSLRVLEVNTLPGFTSHSLVPKAAAAVGIAFGDLVEHLAQRAARRMLYGNRARTCAEGNA